MPIFPQVILRDVIANQPAATAVSAGALFYATDTGVLQRSNGTVWQSYSGSGGVSNKTSTGATGAEPAGPITGDLFLATNEPVIERWSGSVWSPWAPAFPCTPVPNASFSWINQNGATIDAKADTVYIESPANATGDLRLRVINTPATPYTFQIGFIPMLIDVNARCGVCWTNGTAVHTVGPQIITGVPAALGSLKWTNTSTFNSAYTPSVTAQPLFLGGGVIWMTLADDGVNRKASISMNGQDFILYHSVARTDFLTPTQLGFFIEAANANSYNSGITVVSWNRTQ